MNEKLSLSVQQQGAIAHKYEGCEPEGAAGDVEYRAADDAPDALPD